MTASPSWKLPPASAPADLAGAWCAAEVSGSRDWLAALCVAAFLRRAGLLPTPVHSAQPATSEIEDEEREPLVVRWTPRRDALLLDMLEKGMSYSAIAAELDLTRSAISGRISRLRANGVHIPILNGKAPVTVSKPAPKLASLRRSAPPSNKGVSHEVAAKPAGNLNRAAQPNTPLTVASPPPPDIIERHRKNADEIIKILDVARIRHGNDFEIQLEAIVRKTGIDAPSVRSALSEIERRGKIEIQEPFRPGFGYRVHYKRGVAA